MTIHGSRGFKRRWSSSQVCFLQEKDASMSVQDNILVTPQVLAGRIQPWRANDRPQDGLWAFAAEMNKAQDKAELRRKFYVALTRVKDRLILTGSPGNASTFDEETGTLSVRIAPDPRTMGRMFIEGLRRATWCAGGGAPWVTRREPARNNLTAVQTSTISDAAQPCGVTQRCPTGGRRLSRTASLPPFAML